MGNPTKVYKFHRGGNLQTLTAPMMTEIVEMTCDHKRKHIDSPYVKLTR